MKFYYFLFGEGFEGSGGVLVVEPRALYMLSNILFLTIPVGPEALFVFWKAVSMFV